MKRHIKTPLLLALGFLALWSSGAWAADDDSEPPRLWATPEEALLREPAFREIPEKDIVDARRKVDERIQK
ncbi:MAG: hypothetical protein LBS89_08000, partial [Zoogloeaceae bacterium]|nr:hypothetical protein [Zoogloeaceae bacterium]